jgi:hypothetical protein
MLNAVSFLLSTLLFNRLVHRLCRFVENAMVADCIVITFVIHVKL